VQNNLPNADAGAPGAGSQEQRQEETTNYEISRTVRTLVREQPQMRRLNLAVLVDGVNERGADGALAWRPRSPEELESIARLVRTAVGFDERRGDKVEVVTMRFVTEEGGAADQRGPFGLPLERADLVRLTQTGLLGLVAIAALLLVLRPMAVRLSSAAAGGAALAGPAGAVGGLGLAPGLPGIGPGDFADAAAALPGVGALPGLPRPIGVDGTPLLEDESMVKLANIEGQLRASSIRRLTELVDKHPDESLAILRAWLQQEPS
jgi:flagellar M-ring protein FliF